MKRKVVVVGGNILTALGSGEETWAGLRSGLTGLCPVRLPGFPEEYPLGLVKGLDEPLGSAQRLLQLIREVANPIGGLPEFAGEAELVVATTKGAADEIVAGKLGAPQGQPWQLGELVAQEYGVTGKVHTVSAACASGTLALIRGAQRITAGETKVVIVVGVDLVSRFVTAGFASLKGLAPTSCRPFDRERNGLALGEGAGLLVLADEEYAVERGWSGEARLSAWATACDGVHITAPCREGSGLTSVIRQIVDQTGTEVGGINAHGTGTMYNDAMELTAFGGIWGESIPPFHSVKGSIGHCLGAAGVIEAAVAISSLKHGIIPPTTGFREAEHPSPSISSSDCLPLTSPAVLSCNSGFGGINAAVLFTGERNPTPLPRRIVP